ncbi:MAG: hypothetical protein LR017_02385 [Candidatus Pacebacteria bacterium]|nr:hypothetical protein [Candidatus Paceibacterota bacterium]
MRRVYYSFALRLATHTTTLYLAILAVSVYALGYFVHVQAVLNTAAQVPAGEFGPFILRLLANTDGITLVVLGVIIMTSLSIPFSLPNYQRTLRPQAA